MVSLHIHSHILKTPTALCSSRKEEKGGKIAAAFWKSLQQHLLVCARIRVDTAPTPVMKCLECLMVWQTHWCHKIYGVTFEFLNSLTIYCFQKYWSCRGWNVRKLKWDFINHSSPLCAMMATPRHADSGLNINTLMHLFCRCICWRDNLVWPHTLLSLILSPHSRSLFFADIDTLVVLFFKTGRTAQCPFYQIYFQVRTWFHFIVFVKFQGPINLNPLADDYILCIMGA